MGAWNANWQLNIARSTGYQSVAVGKFTLKKVSGQAGKFKVHTSPNSAAAKWLGTVFEQRGTTPGPNLGWPLLASPTEDHCKEAAAWMKAKVKERWGRNVPQFECLVAEVGTNRGPKEIALFKANKGFNGGRDFLIGIFVEDLDGGTAPDGSVIGRRL